MLLSAKGRLLLTICLTLAYRCPEFLWMCLPNLTAAIFSPPLKRRLSVSFFQALTEVLAVNDVKIAAPAHELAYYKRIRFDQKTEALADLQRDLLREEVGTDLAAVEAELRAQGAHRHIRPQYACRHCETMTAAVVPPAIIDGGVAAAVGLLVWVVIGKYLDHSPLYRLEQIAGRSGVNLSRSTLADWVGQVGVMLQLLVDRLSWHLLQGNTLHADETPMPQLDPGKGKTKKAYLWVYRSNDLHPGHRMIVFDCQGNRSGQHARNFLDGWRGPPHGRRL